MSEPQLIHVSGERKVRVLWVSRHPPIRSQVQVLEQKLGGVEIYQLSGMIPNAEYVDEKARELGVEYVIPVLPLSFIARLTELAKKSGYTVLWAEMEMVKQLDREPQPNIDYDPDNEVWIKGYENTYKIMRFKQFHIIKAVKLELEPW